MTWTDIARREHNRDGGRYPSDLTDREWALIAPLLPPPRAVQLDVPGDRRSGGEGCGLAFAGKWSSKRFGKV